jgi:hypothetical protein
MFFLYCVNGKDCDLHQDVTISGILGDHIASKTETIKPKKDDTMPWELSGHDLCRKVMRNEGVEEGKDPASCKIVTDAVYSRDDAMLLEINRIWGFSYGSWTPILLQMSELFKGHRPRESKSPPVAHFQLGSQAQGFVHEFLYLQCGHQGGKRIFARVGNTSAAILYPDALEHLLGQIGFHANISSILPRTA